MRMYSMRCLDKALQRLPSNRSPTIVGSELIKPVDNKSVAVIPSNWLTTANTANRKKPARKQKKRPSEKGGVLSEAPSIPKPKGKSQSKTKRRGQKAFTTKINADEPENRET